MSTHNGNTPWHHASERHSSLDHLLSSIMGHWYVILRTLIARVERHEIIDLTIDGDDNETDQPVASSSTTSRNINNRRAAGCDENTTESSFYWARENDGVYPS